MDGCDASDFDVIDRFLVAHGLDLEVAAEAMALPDEALARKLVDIDVPRDELVRLARGLTPAKLARVVGSLDPVELMFALKKLRARSFPGNQAHVTNLKESPALLAADAAEAAARGFAEIETTVGVARYAPLNAIALLVGSQTGRPGVMTQCAVEERRNLELAIRGLVTYAETLSVYGTEPVFADGDDTPWSKAFLGAAYASRGVKVRFTSGTGLGGADGRGRGEVDALPRVALRLGRAGRRLAGRAERLDLVRRARPVGPGRNAGDPRRERDRRLARSRGRVGQRRDRVALGDPQDRQADGAVPAGHRLRDVRLLRDAPPRQHVRRRQLRRRRPRRVAHDPARLAGRCRHRARLRARPCSRRGVAPRWRCARCSTSSGCPPISDAEVEAATTGYDSSDMPDRDRALDVEAADGVLERGVSGLDVAVALDRHGFSDIARAVVGMQRQRVSADYLQTSSVIAADGTVRSAVNSPNVYLGPGTGYRLEGARWELLQALPHRVDPRRLGAPEADAPPIVETIGEAVAGSDEREVVVAVGPAFADQLRETINGLDHGEVLAAVCEGDPRDRRDAAARADPPRRRRRVHRPRRRAARRLGLRARHAVEGHRRDPPRRPAAARRARAVRHVAALLARLVPRDGPQRGGLRPAASGSARCRPSSTTSRGRS